MPCRVELQDRQRVCAWFLWASALGLLWTRNPFFLKNSIKCSSVLLLIYDFDLLEKEDKVNLVQVEVYSHHTQQLQLLGLGGIEGLREPGEPKLSYSFSLSLQK